MDINAIIGRLTQLLEKATPGEWTDSNGYGEAIFAPNPKGGVFQVAQVRGWGHFIGQGSGGMGMSEADAMEQQNINVAFICATHNHLTAVLAELDKQAQEIDRLRKRVEAAEGDLRTLEHGSLCMICRYCRNSLTDLVCADCKGTPHVIADNFEWRGVTPSTST
jgi:hypothetical protein